MIHRRGTFAGTALGFCLMFAAMTTGASPAEIAEKAFAAIQNEQFYILPNPELLPFLRLRMEAILNQQNPPPIFDGSATPRSTTE